jgi:hypothetical protein
MSMSIIAKKKKNIKKLHNSFTTIIGSIYHILVNPFM